MYLKDQLRRLLTKHANLANQIGVYAMLLRDEHADAIHPTVVAMQPTYDRCIASFEVAHSHLLTYNDRLTADH